ncbi:protein-tyrosine-phosphatase [Roseivirga sp.]|uniref:protein-tyrosine-phosphatase n=1 Tax=Roseivirga sp. TaxID=1964215 RepID=UPI003B516DEB
MNTTLISTIEKASLAPIASDRKAVLQVLIDYINEKLKQGLPLKLNFICTHNSRRSQMSQIWAQAAAVHHQVDIESFSGGVEVTAFNPRAVESCRRLGFDIEVSDNRNNPVYLVKLEEGKKLSCFSKLYDDDANPSAQFAAVMTCSDADENCPFIPGTEARIPLRYEDPKAFDDTPQEAEKYDERNLQIASEMLYVFRTISAN